MPRSRAGGWTWCRPGARESCRSGLGSGPVGAVVRQTNPGSGGARPGPFGGDGGAGRLGVLDEVVVGRPDQPVTVIAVTGRVVGEPGGALPDPGVWPLGPAGAEPASPPASGSIELRSLLLHVRRLLSALLGNVRDGRAAEAETVRSRSWSTGRPLLLALHSRRAGQGLELWPKAGAPSQNARPARNRPAAHGSLPPAGGWCSGGAGRSRLDGLGHASYVGDLDHASDGAAILLPISNTSNVLLELLS
jgi:hypothetical protein